MESTFVPTLEREYGRNALPNLFDAKAKDPSSRPYARLMRSLNPEDGFDTVTYSTVANAINKASWWLVNDVGLAEGEVFAYLGSPDLRYIFLLVAAAKTGRKIMLPSLRNTIPAQMTLLKDTDTRIILYAGELQTILQPLFAAASEIENKEVPSYRSFIDETRVPHYEARELSDEQFYAPMCMLHTSGSSGNPKPVHQSPAFWVRAFSFLDVPDDGDIHSIVHIIKGHNMLQILPLFHMAGLCFMLMIPVLDSTAILNHPAAPITAEHVLKILNQGIATAFNTTDSILTDLCATKEGLAALSKLELIGYGGGSLSPQTGALLAPRVKNLCSILGMTENALFHGVALRGTSHWDCLKLNSKVGYWFEETSPGVHEMVVSLRPEHARYHPAALLFPDLQEFATKDLYTRVPDIDNCYRYYGRRDDLIVLSNGEKINPLPLEAIVATHPLVKSALFVGEHRFLPSLLVELANGTAIHNETESREMVERLWDVISQANVQAPRFSRVPKQLVYVLRPMESFSRSPKGSVQRQVTVRAFASQIEALYAAAAEEGLFTDGLELVELSDFDSIKNLANELYCQVLGFDDGKVLGDDGDVFELGMDSLQAAVAVLKLKAVFRAKGLKAIGDKISPHFFYSSPSTNKLARSIQNLITNEAEGRTDRRVYMQQLIDKCSTGLDAKLPPKKTRKDNLTVVLTGSTGSLGSYLLDTLIQSPRVSRVICLNRSTDAQKRQTVGNKSKNLSVPWESDDDATTAVEFLTADLSSPDLGLGDAVYTRLQATVDAIIHNAWKVDFNHTIESFEKTHIAGTRHLIDLSRKCDYQAPILFISTISTAMNFPQQTAVPESSIHDLNSPEFVGYAESKYVAERLVEEHSLSAGFASAVLRVGQIAGPVLGDAGVWNKQEWFPGLLASAKYLGVLPESLGTMDNCIRWVPVDILARIIIQLFDAIYDKDDTKENLAVYNIVNLRTVPWSTLLETVRTGLGGSDKIRIVPLPVWLESLEHSAQDAHGLVMIEQNPAAKLLDFWRHVAWQSKPAQREFEVADLQRHSSDARHLQAISPDWIKLWMRQWGF